MRLLEGKTTLFQTEAPNEEYSTLFLFNKKGVAIVSRDRYAARGFDFLKDKDAWALTDGKPLVPLFSHLPQFFFRKALPI